MSERAHKFDAEAEILASARNPQPQPEDPPLVGKFDAFVLWSCVKTMEALKGINARLDELEASWKTET